MRVQQTSKEGATTNGTLGDPYITMGEVGANILSKSVYNGHLTTKRSTRYTHTARGGIEKGGSHKRGRNNDITARASFKNLPTLNPSKLIH